MDKSCTGFTTHFMHSHIRTCNDKGTINDGIFRNSTWTHSVSPRTTRMHIYFPRRIALLLSLQNQTSHIVAKFACRWYSLRDENPDELEHIKLDFWRPSRCLKCSCDSSTGVRVGRQCQTRLRPRPWTTFSWLDSIPLLGESTMTSTAKIR